MEGWKPKTCRGLNNLVDFNGRHVLKVLDCQLLTVYF